MQTAHATCKTRMFPQAQLADAVGTAPVIGAAQYIGSRGVSHMHSTQECKRSLMYEHMARRLAIADSAVAQAARQCECERIACGGGG
jgi:hypothetical protein